MIRFILWLALLPVLCFGQTTFTEREMWYGLPLDRLPLGHVKLDSKYDPPKIAGIPDREYREPHRISIGIKNTGTNIIEEVEVTYMFHFGQIFLQTPTNGILTHKVLPGGFYGKKTWSAIIPGGETFFPSSPLWDWFPDMTTPPDGSYILWWEVGTNKSDRLILQKEGQEITSKK